MRTEDEIRRERDRLLEEAARKWAVAPAPFQSDYDRDASMLTWVLGEEDE